MDWASERFCYLTTTGRRSGRPHTIEIWFVARDDTVYLLAGDGDRSDTVRNIRADPAVGVRVGRRDWVGAGRIVDEPAEAEFARRALPAKYAHEEDGLEEWAQTATPVAIDLA